MNETGQADSRRQSMGRPIEGYYAIKSVFWLAFRRFPYPPMSQTRPKRRLERSDGGRSIQSSCHPLQATLAKPLPAFTVPLPCFFPVCLAGTFKFRGEPRKRVKQWDGVKQRLIIGRKLLI
jgi:hypothetical protein